MKALVVFYSRTGNTKKVARFMASCLSADLETLEEGKRRNGIIGYLGAGMDAIKKKGTDIALTRFDPSEYDIVLVGTPVWAYTMTPAVLTYLDRNKEMLYPVVFFWTHGGKLRKTLDILMAASIKPVTVYEVRDKKVINDDFEKGARDFLEKLD